MFDDNATAAEGAKCGEEETERERIARYGMIADYAYKANWSVEDNLILLKYNDPKKNEEFGLNEAGYCVS